MRFRRPRAALLSKYSSRRILIPNHQSKKKNVTTASAMRKPLETSAGTCLSPGQPIFFRNRSEQTQKSSTAMTDMIPSEGQYSRKLAPRRMMARMRSMK